MEFTSLPVAVGCNVISEWITLKDLLNLDRACNSHVTRLAFLKYCQSGTLETEFIELRSLQMIKWFIKLRKLSTSSLKWQKGIEKYLSELLAAVGCHVKEVEICPDSSGSATQICIINSIISQHCVNTRKVKICNLTDMEIAPLCCAWKYIQNLNISECEMTSGSFYNIANMCLNLKYLSLWDIPGICNSGLTALAGNCPELEILFIVFCKRITAKGLVTLVKTTPKLTLLNITISDLSDTDITTITQHCPMLHTLRIYAALLTEVGIQAVASRCTHLQTMHICNCISITTGYIFLRNLNELALYASPTLTDTMVATIVQNNPFLESLLLNGCPQLTAAGVISILHGCPKLHTLTVTNTYKSTTVSAGHIVCCSLVSALIKDQYPKLVTLHIVLN